MGDTGPCGPCSELHYDRIGGRNARELVNLEDGHPEACNVIEIWNLVFMQYNRKPNKSLVPLDDKHIDTGMGFERITSILQNKMSNYDTDIFVPIFNRIYEIAGEGVEKYKGRMGAEDIGNVDMAYRVVADHIRNLTIAISDGCMPGNKDQGYVLRRILRRGVRYGKYMLNMPDNFFVELVDVCVNTLKAGFPAILPKVDLIKRTLVTEEKSFLETLHTGMKLFEDEASKALAKGVTVISGDVAFQLYATHGFPIDLTEILAEENKPQLSVDMDAYATAYKAHQEASKGGDGSGGIVLHMEPEHTNALAEAGVEATDDSSKFTAEAAVDTTLKAIFTVNGFVDSVGGEEKGDDFGSVVALILEATSYYAEGGGQIYDTGTLTFGNDVLQVTNTQRNGKFVLHTVDVSGLKAPIAKGAALKCQVDMARRADVTPNHTCTHMLNFALRHTMVVNGKEDVIDQKGSEVTGDKLRFDFTCSRGLKPAEVKTIEDIVNAQIKEALPIHCKVVPLKDAQAINSLRAVFGESYPDPVRVVIVGDTVENVVGDPENDANADRSVELCGGTHMANTSEAQDFVIIEEVSKSAGVRRITALTKAKAQEAREQAKAFGAEVDAAGGLAGMELVVENKRLTQVLAKDLTVGVLDKADLVAKLKALTKKVIKAKKDAKKLVAGQASVEGARIAEETKATGAKFNVSRFDFGSDNSAAKKMLAVMQKTCPGTCFGVFSADDDSGRLAFYAGVPAELQATLSASDWTNSVKDAMGGKGGGKPGFAQLSGELVEDKVESWMGMAADFAKGKFA